jgi:hypothetical protein
VKWLMQAYQRCARIGVTACHNGAVPRRILQINIQDSPSRTAKTDVLMLRAPFVMSPP